MCTDCHDDVEEPIVYGGYKFCAFCFIKRIRAHVASLQRRAEIFRDAGLVHLPECQEVVCAAVSSAQT